MQKRQKQGDHGIQVRVGVSMTKSESNVNSSQATALTENELPRIDHAFW